MKSITNIVELEDVKKSILVDLLLLLVVYYLPAISHHMAFPLYMFDPMRLVIFLSVLMTRNKLNTYIMAITIPVFSYLIGGHPVIIKSILIGVELLINIYFFWFLLKRGINVFFATFVSIVIAKVFYYGVKVLLVNFKWLDVDIISTPLYFQGLVAIVISILMLLLFNKYGKEGALK